MPEMLVWAGAALLVLVALALYALLLLARARRCQREFAQAQEERMRAAMRAVQARQTFAPRAAPPPEEGTAMREDDAA